ncbi:MAG: sensor histidine kinase [Solirubrobacteraceae bacterium]
MSPSAGLNGEARLHTRWVSPRSFAAGCGVAVAAGSLAVLTGWTFGVARLKNLSPGAVSTKPTTAVALALCGVALVLSVTERAGARVRTIGPMVGAGLAAGIGAVTLLEYATRADLGIDQLLFHEPAHSAGTSSPGRMALMTALALLLAGSSLGLLVRGKVMAQQVLAGGVLVIALSAVLGYLYGTELTRPWGTTEVSAYTVALLVALGVGLLAATSESGFVGALFSATPGGLTARSLLLTGALALPALGALRLAGQHAGLYSDRAGVGIMVLASLLVLVATVSVTAIRLNALDSERASALERMAESERRLRRAFEHLLHVQENERRGLAIDLHDDALPALSAIGLRLQMARDRCDDEDVREHLGRSEADLRAARVRLRHLMLDLIPDALQREGLGSALRHRLEQMKELNGIEYELHDRLGRQPSAAGAAVLYRIALEALRNVTRHADAKLVRVDLGRSNGRVTIAVSDDGIGFRPAIPRPGHLGLAIMTARAELAGGHLEIKSHPGEGTVVDCWVPGDVERTLERG